MKSILQQFLRPRSFTIMHRSASDAASPSYDTHGIARVDFRNKPIVWVLLGILLVAWAAAVLSIRSLSFAAYTLLLILFVCLINLFSFEIRRGPRFLIELLLSVILVLLLQDALQKVVGLQYWQLHKTPLPLHASLLNLLCILALQFLFFALTAKIGTASLLTTALCITYAVAAFLVIRFRNRELIFPDLAAFGTAMSVLSNYEQPPDLYAILPRLVFPLCFCALLLRLRLPKRRHPIVMHILSLCLGGICFASAWMGSKEYSYQKYYWDSNGALEHGLMMNMVLTIRESLVVEPDGYNPAALDALADAYPADHAADTGALPDIVVIMSESFADLSYLGDFETNAEVLPNMEQILADSISGPLLTPVIGGNTIMPEWEFLTGNSTAFFSGNVSPFQQYMSGPAASVVHHMNRLGYDTLGMHPYHATGWNRNTVYEWLGFERTMFLDDFPQQELVRRFVSDRELYSVILEQLDTASDAPQFIFAVSMQNHGAYTKPYEDGEAIYATDPAIASDDLNTYLTLIHETDRATAELLQQLEQRKRPTYVLFFGDHQPQMPTAFYDILQSGKSDLQRMIEQHVTPFFLWSNQDIAAESVQIISPNYLAPLLLETAGLPQPAYYSYLLDLKKTLPAISAFVCYSAETDGFVATDALSDSDAQALLSYQQLQYNALFDKKHQNKHFFGIE